MGHADAGDAGLPSRSSWSAASCRPRLATIATFYANVRDAIRGEAKLVVSAEDGYRTIRLLELALQSSDQNHTLPVEFAA